MGELLKVEFNPSARIKQASEDPILRAFHENVVLGYPVTGEEKIIDNIDSYSKEGMLSELMGWHHISESGAITVFDLARQSVIQDNDVRIDK